jgi:hypothetical protein
MNGCLLVTDVVTDECKVVRRSQNSQAACYSVHICHCIHTIWLTCLPLMRSCMCQLKQLHIPRSSTEACQPLVQQYSIWLFPLFCDPTVHLCRAVTPVSQIHSNRSAKITITLVFHENHWSKNGNCNSTVFT